jgi:hypothetical protein
MKRQADMLVKQRRDSKMRKAEPGKAIFGGFIATAVMTMMMYVAPAMGMPKMDIAAMFGSMLGNQMPAPMTGAWWMGADPALSERQPYFSIDL